MCDGYKVTNVSTDDPECLIEEVKEEEKQKEMLKEEGKKTIADREEVRDKLIKELKDS